MTSSQSTKVAVASPARDLLYAGRYYLAGWRGVLVLAVMAALIGIGFSWSWLVAAGIAPILLSTLPCLIMCGLGLCMSCRSRRKANDGARCRKRSDTICAVRSRQDGQSGGQRGDLLPRAHQRGGAAGETI
jgi:hypothetical protein